MRVRRLLLARYLWENKEFFAGVQGFETPLDQGTNGNFGFHEGLSDAMPIWDELGIGLQAGLQALQSDLSGGGGAIDHSRWQYFYTAGMFRRAAPCGGWQGGVAFDHLTDDFYTHLNVSQLRSEISYVGASGHELGFWNASHLNSNPVRSPTTGNNLTIEGSDLYAFFYRCNACSGGNGRLWGGFTAAGDALVGADARVQLGPRWAIDGAFNYQIPGSASTGLPARLQQDVALSISLVWWPGYRCRDSATNPYRQLFRVADNTNFLLRAK